ncbi:MAG: DUF4426 domain-containing protein [Pseudomonadales bacterium]|nr:DUF4426 domain-containing protein [Pseudomonadales bacterium]
MNPLACIFQSTFALSSRLWQIASARRWLSCRMAASFLLLLAGLSAQAEQMQKLGEYEVHYVVVPTSFFNPAIADRYDIVRGKDRALMNLSILNADQVPVTAQVEGTMTNLLGQQQQLEFTEVREGSAVYYLAPIKHTDRETLRFSIRIAVPGDTPHELKFQQQMYWDGR